MVASKSCVPTVGQEIFVGCQNVVIFVEQFFIWLKHQSPYNLYLVSRRPDRLFFSLCVGGEKSDLVHFP